jgi:hypothetical protein
VRPISDDPAFSGPGGRDILGDLEFLGRHWGSAYDIGSGGGEYTAERRDGRGTKLAAADRDGLCRKMQADYTADPVSRDLGRDLLAVAVIRSALLDRIARGEIGCDGRVPPFAMAAVCADAGIDAGALRYALGELTAAGALRLAPGRGYYVRSRAALAGAAKAGAE